MTSSPSRRKAYFSRHQSVLPSPQDALAAFAERDAFGVTSSSPVQSRPLDTPAEEVRYSLMTSRALW